MTLYVTGHTMVGYSGCSTFWMNTTGNPAIRVKRKLNSTDVIDALTDLFILRGVPAYIRSDNGPEFIAEAVRDWIKPVGAKTAYIEPGSPWENGYCESFNSKLRDELLAREIFFDLREAQILIETWRRHYNTTRPHSSDSNASSSYMSGGWLINVSIPLFLCCTNVFICPKSVEPSPSVAILVPAFMWQ